jgi:SAM-dependent methyltransferase
MSEPKATVSDFDARALRIIRNSVDDLLRQCARKYDKPGRLLDIAPQDYEGAAKFFQRITIETIDIDPAQAATHTGDITRRNEFLNDDSYDVIVCTEVLEHTLNPFDAVKEIRRILKPSGLLIASAPLNFRIHGPLPNCWRFTLHGWRQLLREFSSVDIRSVDTVGRDLMPIHYTVRAIK